MTHLQAALIDYGRLMGRLNGRLGPDTLNVVECQFTLSKAVSAACLVSPPESKACYNNCFNLVHQLKGAEYCLGYTISRRCPVPLEHAWIMHEGIYYDPTFSWLGRMNDPDDCVYGVAHQLTAEDLIWFVCGGGDETDACPPHINSWVRSQIRLAAAC